MAYTGLQFVVWWLRSLFAWRLVKSNGIWDYEENAVTGQRQAWRRFTGVYSPLNWDWLLAGQGMPKIDGLPAWRSSLRDTLPDGQRWA
jgi:hypothetical protein